MAKKRNRKSNCGNCEIHVDGCCVAELPKWTQIPAIGQMSSGYVVEWPKTPKNKVCMTHPEYWEKENGGDDGNE